VARLAIVIYTANAQAFNSVAAVASPRSLIHRSTTIAVRCYYYLQMLLPLLQLLASRPQPVVRTACMMQLSTPGVD